MIFLYILLGIVALICLLLFCNVRLTIRYDGQFRLTLYILGIPISQQTLQRLFQKEKEPKKEKDSQKEEQEKEKYGFVRTVKDLYSFICAILRALRAACTNLKKHLKIHVRTFRLTVASPDAAKTAMRYGEYSALLSAAFAFMEEHTRFRANYKQIAVSADFEKEKTCAHFCVDLKIKPFFLLTTYTGAKLAFMGDLLDAPNATENNTQTKKGTNK